MVKMPSRRTASSYHGSRVRRYPSFAYSSLLTDSPELLAIRMPATSVYSVLTVCRNCRIS